MKTLGVYTKDFSLYHDIVKGLKKRKVAYVSLSLLDNIPRRIGVILTSQKELEEIPLSKTVAVDSQDTIDYAIDLALQKLTGKELYSKIFFGIDPGERPGIAIVGDDILLQKMQVEGPENVASEIKCLSIKGHLYPYRTWFYDNEKSNHQLTHLLKDTD
jgi:hypothetical protein